MKTYTTTFDIYLPATLTETQRIEEIRARHLGLMSGSAIKAMRQRLGLSQGQLTALLDCGAKSLSRWENGHGYPTGMVNKMLRLLDEGFLAPASLEAVSGPRHTESWSPEAIPHHGQRCKPYHYRMGGDWGVSPASSRAGNLLNLVSAS